MSDCVFCDIVAGEAPAHRLYADEDTLAFLDIAPVNPGHALVVPRAHYETFTAMDPDLVADLFRAVRRVAGAVESALDPGGSNLIQANGEAAGQEVFHAHVHVLPRYEDDGMRVRWPRGELSEEHGRQLRETIREEL